MKNKNSLRLICACLCLVCLFTLSICAVDETTAETAAETTVETTVETVAETTAALTTPLEDKNTLEGVLYTFITFFFKDTTVAAYGEFFVKISIVCSIALVYFVLKSIFGIFKKRR